MSLTSFGIYVAFYYALHSVLAADRVKMALIENVISNKYYRLVYNIISLLLLLPLIWLYIEIEKQNLLPRAVYFWIPGSAFVLAGLIWIIRALKGYNFAEFAGFQQLKSAGKSAQPELQTGGLNALVRHPLYFGILLVFWGLFLNIPNDAMLLLAILTTIYLVLGSKLEERKLAQQFGEPYRLYQQHVPMLFPFKWRRKQEV